MNIIEQNHEILSDISELLLDIEVAARTCYKSEDKIGCTLEDTGQHCRTPGKYNCMDTGCYKHSSHKLINTLIKRGHHAMIEFNDIIVKFITNRGVTHELVRHRLFSFAQESTRYVKYYGDMEFIYPVWCSKEIIGNWSGLYSKIPMSMDIDQTDYNFINCCAGSEDDYKNLIAQGWRPEQAREILPNSLKTEIVVKGNIREWRHCLKLRTSKKAHPQIRALMLPLLKEFKDNIPILFDDIGND